MDTSTTAYQDWWEVFNDPELSQLIDTAYQQNLTLQIAGVRILEARARLNRSVGDLFPQQQGVSGGVNYQYLDSPVGRSDDSQIPFKAARVTRRRCGWDAAAAYL